MENIKFFHWAINSINLNTKEKIERLHENLERAIRLALENGEINSDQYFIFHNGLRIAKEQTSGEKRSSVIGNIKREINRLVERENIK